MTRRSTAPCRGPDRNPDLAPTLTLIPNPFLTVTLSRASPSTRPFSSLVYETPEGRTGSSTATASGPTHAAHAAATMDRRFRAPLTTTVRPPTRGFALNSATSTLNLTARHGTDLNGLGFRVRLQTSGFRAQDDVVVRLRVLAADPRPRAQ